MYNHVEHFQKYARVEDMFDLLNWINESSIHYRRLTNHHFWRITRAQMPLATFDIFIEEYLKELLEKGYIQKCSSIMSFDQWIMSFEQWIIERALGVHSSMQLEITRKGQIALLHM